MIAATHSNTPSSWTATMSFSEEFPLFRTYSYSGKQYIGKKLAPSSLALLMLDYDQAIITLADEISHRAEFSPIFLGMDSAYMCKSFVANIHLFPEIGQSRLFIYQPDLTTHSSEHLLIEAKDDTTVYATHYLKKQDDSIYCAQKQYPIALDTPITLQIRLFGRVKRIIEGKAAINLANSDLRRYKHQIASSRFLL